MSYPSQVIMEQLQPGMTEQSLLNLLKALGEPVIKVRIESSPTVYAIIQLPNSEFARSLVYRWNGKVIPDIYPAAIFILRPVIIKIEKYEVWVGNLTSDVDDYQLFKYFSSFYNTVYNVKVIPNKGCGFITFSDHDEHKHCIDFMSGMSGLGCKKIIVSYTRRSQVQAEAQRSGDRVNGLHHNKAGSGSSNIKPGSVLKEVPKEHEDFWRHQHLLVSEAIMPPGEELPDALLRSGNATIEKNSSIDPLMDNTLVEHSKPNNSIEDMVALDQDAVLWDGLESSHWVYGFDDPSELYCTTHTPF